MSQTEQSNPYAPPTTTDLRSAVVDVVKRESSRLLDALIIVQSILIVSSWVGIYINVRTILFSGPTLAAIGAINTVLAFRRSNMASAGFAISTPVFAAFITILIITMRWGPTEAAAPVLRLSTVYLAVAVLWMLALLFLRRNRHPIHP